MSNSMAKYRIDGFEKEMDMPMPDEELYAVHDGKILHVKVLDVTFREPFTDQGYTWEGTAVVIAPDALEHLDLGSIKITRDNVAYTREDAEKLL